MRLGRALGQLAGEVGEGTSDVAASAAAEADVTDPNRCRLAPAHPRVGQRPEENAVGAGFLGELGVVEEHSLAPGHARELQAGDRVGEQPARANGVRAHAGEHVDRLPDVRCRHARCTQLGDPLGHERSDLAHRRVPLTR